MKIRFFRLFIEGAPAQMPAWLIRTRLIRSPGGPLKPS